MEQMMRAIIRSENGLEIESVPRPAKTEAGHLLIKMECCAINPGDQAFIKSPLPPGSVISLYDIYGVSGVGEVMAIGANVPEIYKGKRVTMYRSLRPSDHMIGTWCEYAHMHYLDCAIIPDGASPEEYAGSMVNIITPYAFLQQVMEEGHKGIISTAGTSATGIAMVGICRHFDFPLISIVRSEEGKAELEKLGAENVLAQNAPDFANVLSKKANELQATAIFDGVGGGMLNKIIEAIPPFSTIFSYGYLGDNIPLTVHLRTLAAKGLIIRPFANFRTKTVQNPVNLEKAINEISRFIHQPHFKTRIGKKFTLEEIQEALSFSSKEGKKAILYP
jgi:NADPH:quinone reductase-like Zn-dependent oxidoreductase